MPESNNLNTTNISPPYTFHEFYRRKDGSYMVVAKEMGNPKGVFKLLATDLLGKRRDLLSKFNLDDQINIIGLATTDSPPILSIKRSDNSRYFALLAMMFGCALITSNIASSKLMLILGGTFTGGTLPYMMTYVTGDIITEVYGYKKTRQLIWGAIVCNLIMVFFIKLAILAPASPLLANQSAYALVLGSVPRIVFASLISYFFGEFINSYAIAKLKILQNGKKLWLRIVLSSFLAITVDNFLFLFIAYFQVMAINEMIELSNRSYFIGLIFEWLSIPFITIVTNKLKSIENIDIFDIETNFTPFSLDTHYRTLDS